jgi:AcrR family transcriptional regulator
MTQSSATAEPSAQPPASPARDLDDHVVSVAADLFNARGISAVTMDQLRDAANVSLKRLYSLYPSKDALVQAVLARRHDEWVTGVNRVIAAAGSPRERMLAVFDFLAGWFLEPEFRGCAFINTFAELGPTSPAVADIVREHKRGVQKDLERIVAEAGGPEWLAPQLSLLSEGAQTTAAIMGSHTAAAHARAAAATLIDAAYAEPAAS